MAMKSAAKRKSQREVARLKRLAVPDSVVDDVPDPTMDEEMEVHFNPAVNTPDSPPTSPTNSPDTTKGETGYAVVLDMVQNLRDKLSALNLDNTNIRAACEALRRQCHSQGVAFGDLSQLVKQSLEGQQYQQPREDTRRSYPLIRPELIDGGGNLRAEDIGITWQGGDTFLHGVRIAGPREDMEDTCHRPAMSTPYPPGREHPSCDMETPRFPRPVCIEMSDTPTHCTGHEGRPSHRPAAPIQRFNNKTIGWPAWFRHFKAVADVHGWDKDQRALQMVSYPDKKAMNVAQELSDRELYDYDVLVKLLGDRFDPASRVSASRSRFHDRTRRHQVDADTYADSITELCRLGYPQSSPELRQELISEQFVRGQSDPELKKYLWVVIRTQKDRKLQTLIEVCTAFTDRRNRCSQWRKKTTKKRRCSPWWCSSSGTHGGRRNHLCPQSYSKCLPSRVAWATRCCRLLAVLTPLDRCRVHSRLCIRNIAHHSDLATIQGPNASAVDSWDTHKFAAPNRTLPSHSDRTGGSTGQTDHSDAMADPHRETKYRPGPNPHWPVCHRFGPRFIIHRHPRYSPGKFICLHTPWRINY